MLNSYYNSWDGPIWNNPLKQGDISVINSGYSGIADSVSRSWDGPKPQTILDKLHPVRFSNKCWVDSIDKIVDMVLRSNTCPIIDTFGTDNRDIIVKWPENSRIMAWHFRWLPVVPWVVWSWLIISLCWLSRDVYSWKKVIIKRFKDVMLPWDTVKPDINSKSLRNENWEEYLSVEESSWVYSIRRRKYWKWAETELWGEQLDQYLLQNWDFRFMTWFAWLKNKKTSNPKVWDVFQWYYKVPDDFNFYEESDWKKNVVPYLLEEFAAQIWSISFWERLCENMRLEDWKFDESKRTLLTFDSSICKFSWIPLQVGDTFRLVGKIKTLSDKNASFEYVWYNSNWEVIIEWIITWNIVWLKLIKRAKRAKLKKLWLA